MEGRCYCCGKAGHKSPKCRLKDSTPKDKWAINMATKEKSEEIKKKQMQQQETKQSHAQVAIKEPEKEKKATDNTNAWAILNKQESSFVQADEMHWCVLLDNQSTASIYCNESLVKNIHEVDDQLVMGTNGGKLRTSLKAEVPGYGEVWYSKDAITNILSFAEVQDKYQVGYSSDKEAFIVKVTDDLNVEFKRNGNLYYYKPKYRSKEVTEESHVNSVEENKSFFTPVFPNVLEKWKL